MPDGIVAIHAEDVALLDALRLGDGDAAALLMQRHTRTLWRIARGILKDDGEAEEAVQGYLAARLRLRAWLSRRGEARHLARAHRDQ